VAYSLPLEDEDGNTLTVTEQAERLEELLAQEGLGKGYVIGDDDLAKIDDILDGGDRWDL
jgi:hypothetical protein